MPTPIKTGAELLVNTTTAGVQADSSVAGLVGGGFVVAWTDDSRALGDVLGQERPQRLLDRPALVADRDDHRDRRHPCLRSKGEPGAEATGLALPPRLRSGFALSAPHRVAANRSSLNRKYPWPNRCCSPFTSPRNPL